MCINYHLRDYDVKRQSDKHLYHNGDMSTLAQRLKEAREGNGLTQTELAKKAKLKNQSIIGSLESGYRKASSYIPQIAEALGVNALWLAEGVGGKYKNSDSLPEGTKVYVVSDPEKQKIIEGILNLGNENTEFSKSKDFGAEDATSRKKKNQYGA